MDMGYLLSSAVTVLECRKPVTSKMRLLNLGFKKPRCTGFGRDVKKYEDKKKKCQWHRAVHFPVNRSRWRESRRLCRFMDEINGAERNGQAVELVNRPI
jgi:hypothetical protein